MKKAVLFVALAMPVISFAQSYPGSDYIIEPYNQYNPQSYGYSQSSDYYRFPPSYINNCYLFDRNMGIGSRGQDVAALQQELQSMGYFISDPYGVFGPSTVESVTRFQWFYSNEVLSPVGLSAGTGYVGPATRTKLNAMFGCGLSPALSPGGYPYYAGAGGQYDNYSFNPYNWNQSVPR